MKFAVSAVIGAIIGYITNWLAIKMLFRPYKELRILGMKIPFTPGLIPKERYRISKSVGETVGTHLLSNETIVEALTDPKIKEQISTWIGERFVALKNSTAAVGDFIKGFAGSNGEEISSAIEEKLAGYAVRQMRSEKFKNSIIDIIEKELLSVKLVESGIFKKIKSDAAGYINRYASSENLKENINCILNSKINEIKTLERNLNELIPSEAVFIIKQYVYQNESKMAEAIGSMLENESTQAGIREAAEGFVEQSLGKLVTMFVKPEFVSGKIIEGIQKYISNPENHPQIAGLVTNLIDRLMERKASEIFDSITPEMQTSGVNGIVNLVVGYISNEGNQKKLIDIIEKNISENDEDIKHAVKGFIKESIELITGSEKAVNQINMIIGSMTQAIMDKPVSAVFAFIDDSFIEEMIGKTEALIDDFIKNKAVYIAELLDVQKLVENKINEFDVEFAEKIIIDIANKELNAITWLGALLGGIIGLLSPVLQNIF